jgi:broad specificity phosphatase PhoE
VTLTLYFLRHGQTPDSRANVFCGSGRDPDLTEDGVAMAAAFAGAYGDPRWTAICASPLRRAMQTARAVAAAAGMPIEERDELAEIAYGAWEGRTAEQVDRDFHDDYVRWTADPAWNPPTGGEPAITVARRVRGLIDDLTSRHESGQVLLVSHKATIRIALCSLLDIDVGRFRYRLGCPVASLSVVELAAHGPLLHRLADRAHLDDRLRSLPGT